MFVTPDEVSCISKPPPVASPSRESSIRRFPGGWGHELHCRRGLEGRIC